MRVTVLKIVIQAGKSSVLRVAVTWTKFPIIEPMIYLPKWQLPPLSN